MKVSLVGIGAGTQESMTLGAKKALLEADAIIGAGRVLKSLPEGCHAEIFENYLAAEVAKILDEHPQWERAAVAFSGDIGFYSGTKKLLPLLKKYEVKTVCGISSLQYFAASLGRSWQDMHLVSAHGKDCDVMAEVLNSPEVFFLTGGSILAQDICEILSEAGLGDAGVTVGENLSYPNERIISGAANELQGESFGPLAVVLVENRKTFNRDFVTQGIADEEFIRGEVPMTKQEIRAVALAKLRIRACDTAWDIGAGTGSVAVEMALAARRGQVYAVESESAGCDLIEQNREKFGVYNLKIVNGMAPAAAEVLPAPAAVFVGGSKGNLREILETALEKNPHVRIVVTAIALETLAQATEAMESLKLKNVEVTQISAARTHKAGKYNLLIGLNPVFIISGEGDAK